MYRTPDYINEPLYVVTPIFNAPRYKSRWKLYQRFAKQVDDAGGILVTVEAAFGERAFAIEPPKVYTPAAHHTEHAPDVSRHPHPGASGRQHIYLQVRTGTELWTKENLINLAIARLPIDWKYVAWVDADVQFARPNWVGETIHGLQHYAMMQMFSQAQDLGPTHQAVGGSPRPAFVTGFVQGLHDGTYKFPVSDSYYYGARGATGLAWAARRDAINGVGRLMDHAILGASDWHMAHALFGHAELSMPEPLHPEYKRRVMRWQELADRHIRGNVGVVDGLILHYWHGKKVDRQYDNRWKILVDNAFNPNTDIKYDWQGVLQLEDDGTPRAASLRDGLRAYFRARNEDSIDE